jgi:His/Glu/Gln/Arg/opine family amino acid ABC transporter permease subunit
MAGSLGDWSLIWDDKGQLLRGLKVAVEVSALALVLAVVLGLIIAVLRMTKGPLSWLAWLYINIFRGLPALVTALWVYFGLSLAIGVNLSSFQAGVITLTALYSAFIAEIFRSALLAVPAGHKEAGQALGMRSIRIFVSVTLPQATKIAVPNIGSMFIGMVKDTSTLTLIGLVEVVRVTQNIVSVNFQYFPLYSAAAIIYILAAFVIDLLFRLAESGYSVPPKGAVSKLIRSRRQRQIEQLVTTLEPATT